MKERQRKRVRQGTVLICEVLIAKRALVVSTLAGARCAGS